MRSQDVAVSGDGRLVAVRRGATVTVYTLEAVPAARGGGETPVGGALGEAELPGPGGTLVFAGACLLDVTVADGKTTIAALPAPRLGKVTTMELPVACRVVAESGRHVLLDGGATAYVVHVQGESVGYAPMRVGGTVDWAIGIPDDAFLTSGTRGVEVWDAGSRRPTGKLRVALGVTPRQVGVASQRRNLWATSEAAEVRVLRVSDGKPMHVALPAPAQDAVGHPATSWLVADVGDQPHAINLVTGSCEPLPAPRATARALAPRGSGGLVVQLGRDGELELWEIGPAPVATGGGLKVDVGIGAAPRAARTEPRGEVVLRPDVEITLAGGPGRAEPPSIARWVAPELEQRLAALAAHLRRTWLDLIAAAWLDDTVATRDRVVRQLIAEARSAVLVQGTGDVDDAGRLTLRQPLEGAAVAAPWTQVRLARGEIVQELAITRTTPRIERVASPDLVEPAPERPTFAGQLDPGTIATLGGHTLLARLGAAHVVVDPRLGPVRGRAGGLPAPVAADLPPLAAILLTSEDAECLDPATLVALDRRVPVLVPAAPRARIAGLVTALGFGDVREVAPGARVALGDGAVVHVLAGAAAAPRARARVAYVLADDHAAAYAGGAFGLDDEDVPGLVARLAGLGRVSPLFLAVPRRRQAPIESGWQWLFEPAARWIAGHPATPPRLDALGDVAIVVAGEADPYDRYRLGGGPDGWLEPRHTGDRLDPPGTA